MSDGRDFGTIINERRLELGYSLGQLANRIGVTAAQVRAWERGAETPDDATVGRIAGELDLPGAELRGSIRSRGASTAPATAERPEEATAAVMAVFSDAGDTVSAAEPAGDEPVPVAGGPDAGDRPVPGVAGPDADTPGSGAPSGGSVLVDEPTEAVDVIVAPVPAGEAIPAVPVPSPPPGMAGSPSPDSPLEGSPSPVATVARAPVTTTPPEMQQPGLLAGWNRALRTLFDPERRYLFWLRTALTVLILLVFLRVLAWAVPAFFDTLGDILDTIETTTDTTIVDGGPGTGPPTSGPSTTLPTG